MTKHPVLDYGRPQQPVLRREPPRFDTLPDKVFRAAFLLAAGTVGGLVLLVLMEAIFQWVFL